MTGGKEKLHITNTRVRFNKIHVIMYRINKSDNNITKLEQRLFSDLGFRERESIFKNGLQKIQMFWERNF